MTEVLEALSISPYVEDDDLIEFAAQSRETSVRIYAPSSPAIVLGRGSKPEAELHLDACLKDGIPILRRQGGGCAVVIDPGNVIVSVVLPTEGIGQNPRYFEKISDWLITGLNQLRISGVHKRGISDLALGDRKIAGASIYRTTEYLYYSATILVDPNVDLIERYLKHPPREPSYRQGRQHRQFITSLKEHFPTLSQDALLTGLQESLNLRELLTETV